MSKKQSKQANAELTSPPPVVTVLGHVDHGKTSLLDAIRKTDIAGGEHGGITQKIGASTIEFEHEKQKHTITFIDTPGHEAFSKMRSRGARVADIALLIVSAVDGLMPQTKESIQLILESKIPYIVVFTKSDLPTKNLEKAKQQLLKEEVLLEGLGGDVPFIEVSSKTNHNIKELLELILLVFELNYTKEQVQKQISAPFMGIIIESKLDNKSGAKATMVVKQGKISYRDEIECEDVVGKVRSLINDHGQTVQEAGVGTAIEILGFGDVPPVGGIVYKKGQKPQVVIEEVAVEPEMQEEATPTLSLNPFDQEKESPLSIIICADTQGSLEAIVQALPKEIKLMRAKTGEISEADVLLAKSVNGIVLGFNSKIRGDVMRLATTEKILVRNYAIIYEMLDEISDVLEGKQLALIEKIYGRATILASFPFEKTKALGVAVTEGRIAKGDKIRLMRGDDIIGESTIASVRSGKNQVSKIEKGHEAGMIISPQLDFIVGDMLVCHG